MTGSKIKTETIPSQAKGWVAFVGSGPGDPDLLTVRAASLLREADVVITELPEHEQLVRVVLGLPEPRLVTDEDGNEALEEVGGPEFVDGGARKSGVSGKSVAVRVDLGGRRFIKKKTTTSK